MAAGSTTVFNCAASRLRPGRLRNESPARGIFTQWRSAGFLLKMILMHVDSIRIEPATIEDLPELTDLVFTLLSTEADFRPNAETQRHGLQLILEQPSRGRIFVLRNDHKVIGMVNLLFTISTAEGGFVLLMEDVIIHPEHRGQGHGTRMVAYVKQFAAKKDFKRITLLTDRVSEHSQRFFAKNGFVLSHMVPMRLMLLHETE